MRLTAALWPMNKFTLLLALVLFGSFANANEMFSVDPTKYVLSGKDRYDNYSYELSMIISRKNKKVFIEELQAKIYEQSISVGSEILKQAQDIHVNDISVTNDAGIFGSYFYIKIPYGKRGRCKFARKYKLTKSIYISTGMSKEGTEIEAKISDPCEKP